MILTVVFALAVIQIISAQGPPPPPPFLPNLPVQCRQPPQNVNNPHACCKIPPFFAEEDFEECGFKKLDEENRVRRPGPPDCSKQMCMLEKYELVKEKNAVDHDKLSTFMDKWVDKNPEFKAAVETAKSECVGKELPGPPHICEANKLVFCISSILFANCPTWETTESCKRLKDHMDECAPYFKQNKTN